MTTDPREDAERELDWHREQSGDNSCNCETCQLLRGLSAEVASLRAERDETKALYHELLYQVATKHPNETRHETALRYLRRHEEHCGKGGPVQARASSGDVEGAGTVAPARDERANPHSEEGA